MVAMVITALIVERKVVLVVFICILAIVANLPGETISGWGLDKDYLIAGLITIVVLPILIGWIEN